MLWGFLAYIFTFYIILPIGRFLWRGFRLYRQWRAATDPLRRAYRQAREDARRQAYGDYQPPRKRKKIDPAVGEYVKFEEIKAETSESAKSAFSEQGTYSSYKVESQIEEADWEELPSDK